MTETNQPEKGQGLPAVPKERSPALRPDARPTTISDRGLLDAIASTYTDRDDPEPVEAEEAPAEAKPESTPPDTAEDAEPEAEDAEEAAEDSEEQEAVEAETEGEEVEAPQSFTVKIDGKEEQVTLDEALNGYMRQAAFTRKTQAHAESVKAFDAEKKSTGELRQKYEQGLAIIEQELKSLMPEEPNWEALKAEDPVKFASEWASHQQQKAKLQIVAQERARVAQITDQERQRDFYAHVKQEYSLLQAAIPEWADATKAKAEQEQIANYAKSLGYQPEELEATIDHRAILLMRKSMLYDQQQEKVVKAKSILKSKIASPTLLKSGSKPAPSKKPLTVQQATRKQLAKTGKVRDAAAAIEAIL